MKSRTVVLACWITASVINSYALAAEPSLVSQAKDCTQLIHSRLERLACFDTVFDTAISQGATHSSIIHAVDKRPAFWHQVVAQEKRREDSDVFVTNYQALEAGDNAADSSNLILSQSAQGTLPPRPILVISCLDNITRLQILLHQPIDEGMTPLSLVIDGQPLASRWFSESNGYLIRAGRGLPGIEDIRSMFAKRNLVIRSKVPELEGLSFDLSHLLDDIKPLRQACHW